MLKFIAQALQYGTAPALLMLSFMIWQVRNDFTRMLKKQEAIEERLRIVEQGCVKKEDCVKDTGHWHEDMKELSKKVQTVTEELSFFKGVLKPLVANIKS
jgi:hypothetical protein